MDGQVSTDVNGLPANRNLTVTLPVNVNKPIESFRPHNPLVYILGCFQLFLQNIPIGYLPRRVDRHLATCVARASHRVDFHRDCRGLRARRARRHPAQVVVRPGITHVLDVTVRSILAPLLDGV